MPVLRVARVDRERLFVIGDGFIKPARPIQRETAVVIGEIIVLANRERAIEKGERIFPHAKLVPRLQHTTAQHDHRSEHEDWSRTLRQSWKQRELQTHDWQVGITIGHVM